MGSHPLDIKGQITGMLARIPQGTQAIFLHLHAFIMNERRGYLLQNSRDDQDFFLKKKRKKCTFRTN
ncbi:hypothetical protein A2635_05105 [Candidatus Peribacteria bacterium RIFCSPHIGHO2_01_FULL_51_9]|nr:MAG: hypothetical protein A2635_05105 [Candidatus Peribacteria bacterium RIFCSPHIGHO2_01_FULL_51_9]